MDANGDTRVVLVHDWLTGMRGGEKCLESLCRRWPDARLFTLLHKPGSVSPEIEALNPRTSLLQRLPRVHLYYRYLLPLMPAAITAWRVPSCDLLVSFSHCVAKAAKPPLGVPHVCYCFTPMRYAWHMQEAYFGQRGLKARLVDRCLELLRVWDRHTAANVSHFVAISKTVQKRIKDCYDRESVVIYPPADTDFYTPAAVRREDFYLAVSAFAPYKRLDLAVSACTHLGKRLVVIGSGQDEERVRSLAGSCVSFLGWQSDEVIRDHMRRARALIFPGEEDYGIVPVEAMACGTPVIAFNRGGVTETVVGPGGRQPATGLFFEEQTKDALIGALEQFERTADTFDPAALRKQAKRFDAVRFTREFYAYLDGMLGKEMRQAA